MSFQNGKISFRAYLMDKDWPANGIRALSDQAAMESPDAIGSTINRGWAMGSDWLNTSLRPLAGGLLYLAWRTTFRKVQPALLKAKVQAACRAAMEADGKTYLKRKQKAEIRQTVEDAMRAESPPHLDAMEVLMETGRKELLAETMTLTEEDQLAVSLSEIVRLRPFAPLLLLDEGGGEITGRGGTSFSESHTALFHDFRPGCDFLTWLWWASEQNGGRFQQHGFGTLVVMVDGPLVFQGENDRGALVCRLSNGAPTAAAEARSAFQSGKTLAGARLTIGTGEEDLVSFRIEADTFLVRGMTLPKSEAKDPAERIAERHGRLMTWMVWMRDLFRLFLDDYGREVKWTGQVVPEIRKWAGGNQSGHAPARSAAEGR